MTRDLIFYLILGGAGLFGTALLAAAPVAFRHEYAKDPQGLASGFAIEVPAATELSRFVQAIVVAAMLAAEVSWSVRGAR